jgi:hypothetical protein
LTINHQSAEKDKKVMAGRRGRTTALIAMSVFSLMAFSALSAAPSIFAQTTSGNNTGVGGSNSSSTMENMVLNLGTPLFIDHFRDTNTANITQNVSRHTFEGNGTFMLPTGNMSTTDLGYSVINSTEGLVKVSGQVLIKTIDGKESATVDFARFTPINSTMGVGIAYIKTNSTGQLAPLNNTLMVYKNEAISQTQSISTFWKWK